jgi:hypothetical protein
MILDDLVENVVVWDGNTETWQPPPEYLMEIIPEGLLVSVGWGWDGENFVAPPAPEPIPLPTPNLNQPGSAPDVIQ